MGDLRADRQRPDPRCNRSGAGTSGDLAHAARRHDRRWRRSKEDPCRDAGRLWDDCRRDVLHEHGGGAGLGVLCPADRVRLRAELQRARARGAAAVSPSDVEVRERHRVAVWILPVCGGRGATDRRRADRRDRRRVACLSGHGVPLRRGRHRGAVPQSKAGGAHGRAATAPRHVRGGAPHLARKDHSGRIDARSACGPLWRGNRPAARVRQGDPWVRAGRTWGPACRAVRRGVLHGHLAGGTARVPPCRTRAARERRGIWGSA